MASIEARPSEDPENAAATVMVCETNDEGVVTEKLKAVQWQPGFRARFPFIGAVAMVIMLCCLASVGIILGTSHNKFRNEWPFDEPWKWREKHGQWTMKAQIEPHVLLAITNTISNVALAIAIGQGVAIAWWRRAMQGSTIRDLHRSWGFATSSLDLLTAGKRFNMIALAALMAKVALIDNVLLQRSAITEPGVFYKSGTTLSLPMVRELPSGYAGFPMADTSMESMTYAFGQDISTYMMNENLIDPGLIYSQSGLSDNVGGDPYNTRCAGYCPGLFEGFGFRFTCTDVKLSSPYQVTPEAAASNVLDSNPESLLRLNPLLEVQPEFIAMGQTPRAALNRTDLPASTENQTLMTGSIGVLMKWSNLTAGKDPSICSAVTAERFCRLTPAVVQYSVLVQNLTKATDLHARISQSNGIKLIPNVISRDNDTSYVDWNQGSAATGQFNGMTIIRDAYTPYNTTFDSNLEAIANFMASDAGSSVVMEYVQTTNTTGAYVPNVQANNRENSMFARRELYFDPGESCATQVSDPLHDLAYDLNRLMLISSMRASTNYKLEQAGEIRNGTVQSWSGQMGVADEIYRSNWWFGAAAMVVNFLCLLCVLPSYWKFWELGRKVTLGPIEVAGAFQAPILDHPTVSGNGEVDVFVKEIGKRQVRYGEVQGQQKLGVAGLSDVRPLAYNHY